MRVKFVCGIILTGFLILSLFQACKKDPVIQQEQENPNGWVYDPSPYVPTLLPPTGIPPYPDLFQNPLTEQGVKLGRELFYDPVLSADSTLSCSGCHDVKFAFTNDGLQFSVGIDGISGTRNSMPIFNLAYEKYNNGFFWDGRAPTLEDQAIQPIQNPIEMHETLPNVVAKLMAVEHYREEFYEAFGTDQISAELIGDAIAQFTKSIVSGDSKYDKSVAHETFLTAEEVDGYMIFNDYNGGDCFHCHGINGGLFTDYLYRNNGLDSANVYTDFADPGLGAITGKPEDYGKFKTPSLRNIALTAPYMHDGRFTTLEQVIDFYSTGVHDTPFTDPFMQFAFQGGVQLNDTEKTHLIDFLKTLTDSTLINNPDYQNPFPN